MLEYLIIDVDGTMTDSGVYYDSTGNEMKKFSTRDAVGFFSAKFFGVNVVVLTGRKCEATKRRMEEMGVKDCYQGIRDKYKFVSDFISEKQIKKENIGYIGDDLNDLKAMRIAGFVACPNDACEEVKLFADYISVRNGGNGVVRDVVEYLLKKDGKWIEYIADYVGDK